MSPENLLMLPGMMCDRRLFEPQIAALDLPILVADTGRDDNFRDMATRALDDAPQTFAVVGLSMGGILAFEMWRLAPERITHVALMDTNPHPELPARRALRHEEIREALGGGLRSLAIESMKPLYLAAAHRGDDRLLETILDMAVGLGPAVFERQSLALRDRVDSVPTLATIDCPALVLCGAEDQLCPPAWHELMAREIPSAELVVVEDCGHMATLEQPQVVTAALRRLFDNDVQRKP